MREKKISRVVLTANWDWVLFNFRLPLAGYLKDVGFEVILICPRGEYFEQIQSRGFTVIEWKLDRRSISPLNEIHAIRHLSRLYRELNPDLVHHFTIKPIVYGSIAARLARATAVVSNFTGLGFLFSEAALARFLRWLVSPVIRFAARGKRFATLFQNEHDRDLMLRYKLTSRDQSEVIPGTGVDLSRFKVRARRVEKRPVEVLMAARLLLDKGLAEYVEAAKSLKQRGVGVRFRIAGEIDEGNPAHVPADMLAGWKESDAVDFLGHRADMDELLRQADIAVLPSYHEGVPLFLIEAAAAGLPIVATDIPGCRMVVEEGQNGLLVPVKKADALADAIAKLALAGETRAEMGRRSRKIAEERFSIEQINQQYLDVYRKLGLVAE